MNAITARRLTTAVLMVVAGGAVTAAALIAPNALQAFRPFIRSKTRSNEERERVRKALARLRERRLVEVEWRGDKAILKITVEGRRYLRRLEFENLRITAPKRWDGKWRLVIFDIPEQFAKARGALRAKLEDLGFLRLQKSVFVYPHECRDEVDFVVDFFHLRPFVQYVETVDLDHREASVRKHFRLLHFQRA